MNKNSGANCISACCHALRTIYKQSGKYFLPLLITTMTTFGPGNHALAQGPAVSGVNTRVGGSFGYDENIFGSIGGSIRAPLGHAYGISVNLGVAASNGDGDDDAEDDTQDDRVIGYGVSGFWRDPEIGIFAVGASRTGVDGEFNTRVSMGSAYYAPNWTIGIGVGKQTGTNDTWFGNVGYGYYLNENLFISTGIGADDDDVTGSAGIQWQPGKRQGFPDYSLFARGGNNFALMGFTLYFGTGKKSLKRRHRED